ncbi:hypothetical protein ACFFUB_01230 [Algimonas porphyrae]|uniref:Lipoprotein n=1 Tax=Algimonas porphyrae TaxID=1128113 RepID=A0ABQ5UZD6_9PROT|nr:hypothetical protein [Algimonas porphyrae]GLQ20659.1 hypothetical protein GCM10007854_16140 [Algimonas porphyrae]
MIGRKTALKAMIGLTCATALAGCADAPAADQVAPIDVPASHAKLVAVITEGRAAEQMGDRSALENAGTRLVAMKARPIGGSANLADRWQPVDEVLPPMRGRVQGPGYRVAELATGETDTFQEIFYGIEETQVSVSGLGDYTINILDDDGQSRFCDNQTVCRFTPDVTARYRIEIRNQGEAGTYIFVVD